MFSRCSRYNSWFSRWERHSNIIGVLSHLKVMWKPCKTIFLLVLFSALTLFVQEINMIILTSRNFEWFDECLSVIFRSSLRRCSIRKGVLRNFAKFTGKHLRQSHCFKKRDSGPGVCLWILENFSDHLFYRTRLSDCFSILYCGWLYMVGIDNASSQNFFKFRVIVIVAVTVVDTRIWYGDFEFWIRFCKEETYIASDS